MNAVIAAVAIVVAAPLLQGAMKSLRARLQGRPGPNPLQPFRELRKLARKEAVLPEGTSFVAVVAPGIVLGVALTAALMLPRFAPGPSTIGAVAFVTLLALGRFVLALAALDMRSAFTGMAASRDLTFASLAEPTLLVALLSGPGVLTFGAFFLVLLLETARVPIDNQETHYELTMMHEGLTLEYSGWQLACVQYAAWIRQAVLFVLAAWMLTPARDPVVTAALAAAVGIAVTLVETLTAKIRLFEIPQFLTCAFILAATGFVARLIGAPV